MTTPDPTAVQANAFSIAYRLLGDRPAAQAAVGIAIERTHLHGDLEQPDWLCRLAEATVAASVGPASGAVHGDAGREGDQEGIRAALRRRLSSASTDQRVAASLHHLAGYPLDAVAGFMGRPVEEVATLASTIAPPPGVDYRSLGDPRLIGTSGGSSTRHRRPLPITTILTTVVVIAVVFAASRCVGPRPRLGPESEQVPVQVGPSIAAVASEGCSGPPQPPGTFSTTAAVPSGPAASFRLGVPVAAVPSPSVTITGDTASGDTATGDTASGDTASGSVASGTPVVPRPLVLAISDVDVDVDAFLDSSQLETLGLEAGSIVATFSPPADRAGTTTSVEDAGAVLAETLRRSCIDTTRVTVTGLGTGAQTATALACSRPTVVASVAAVGGASMPPPCDLSPAVSLLLLSNADDQVFPPTGGRTPGAGAGPDSSTGGQVGAPLPADPAGQVAETWGRAVGAAAPQRSTAPDSTVIQVATAPSGVEVQWVTAPSGGHAWTPTTTEAVLAFAATHARGS